MKEQLKSRRGARWSIALIAAFAGCDPAGEGEKKTEQVKLTIASVDNPQMQDLESLLPKFHADNPDIKVEIVFLPENQLRQNVTESVQQNTGKYDAFTIGTYEVPIWGKAKQIVNLKSYLDADPGYAADDLIPGVANALKVNGELHALPFYGESSFLMYRKDLLAAKGVTLPERPTWQQVREAAVAVHNPGNGLAGICLRGLPGWGESIAALGTVVNAHGGRWFDEKWNPQLTTPEWKAALGFYANLLKDAGEANPTSYGFTQCLEAYQQGKVAMWYDATVAASIFNAELRAKTGYSYAPTTAAGKANTGWLWAWTLAIPISSTHPAEAYRFLSWATDQKYIKLVGNDPALGWSHVPPGTRTSTYDLPEYKAEAGAYAAITLDSIKNADVNNPTTKPVPYRGTFYVDVPEFQVMGTQVSEEFARLFRAEANVTVDSATAAAQAIAEKVGEKYRTTP